MELEIKTAEELLDPALEAAWKGSSGPFPGALQ
jgi:hypothetical protein